MYGQELNWLESNWSKISLWIVNYISTNKMFPCQTKEAVTAIKDQKCKNATELFVCFFYSNRIIFEKPKHSIVKSVGTLIIAFR